MAPGKLTRTDYEYVRCGAANIYCIVEPLTGRRLTFATANRKAPAFVRALRKVARRGEFTSSWTLSTYTPEPPLRPCSESLMGIGCGAVSSCTTRPSTRAGST